MIRTGILGIDEMLGSGIPEGARGVFSLEPGVDGRPFILRILQTAVSDGKNALVIAPQATDKAFLSEFYQVMDMGRDREAGRIIVLDSTLREQINSKTKGSKSRLKEWQKNIREAILNNGIDVLVVYFDLLYEDLGLDRALSLLPSGEDSRGLTTIVEQLNLEGDSLISQLVSGGYFDLVISVHSAINSVPFFNFFTLEYVSWAKMPRRSIPYTVSGSTIQLYIPKIIVTGPPSSGKTTFVENASDRGLSADRGDLDGSRTTVTMDLGCPGVPNKERDGCHHDHRCYTPRLTPTGKGSSDTGLRGKDSPRCCNEQGRPAPPDGRAAGQGKPEIER